MALKTIEGKTFHYLDLDVDDRLALVSEAISIHERANALPGREKGRFLETEMAAFKMRVGAQNPEAAEFIERKLRPGGDDPVPLEHPREPSFFQPHQKGPAPITLREMKANYERVLKEQRGATDGK